MSNNLRERMQNPVLNNTVRLRLFMYNGNNLNDVVSMDSINLFVCDPTAVTMEDPLGRTLIQSLDVTQIVHEATGTYYIDVPLITPTFTVGRYTDQWTMTVDDNIPAQTVQNEFRIYPELWYSTPVPVVYDFSFDFQPNKIRQGSKQYLRIRVTPNVPKATDLARYYENLAIVGDIKVTLKQKCGPCLPTEEDLLIIFEDEPVTYKENCFGFYLFDTCALDLECGVYGISFSLDLGGNHYISDEFNLQIFN